MRKNFILILLIALFTISCEFCPDQSRGDGFEWQFSTPEEQGLDSDQLEEALDKGEDVTTLYSVLVVRNGSIVAERYYRGYSETSAFNVRSVSKSYLSAMLGIAIEQGTINSTNEKMIKYFPDYDSSEIDERTRDITIKHLLTMQGGLEHEQYNYSRLYYTNNWIKSAIEEPLTYDPGERHSYNTFHTHLLSGIITKQFGRSTYNFGTEFLCDPLGTTIQNWEKDAQGIYFGGNSMFFTTRDMAVLGYLYLNNGEINGVRIVPGEWVKKSIKNTMPDWQSGWTWGPVTNGGYGYLWWLGKIQGYDVFMAIGYGGQFIVCFPQLDLIIATNSDAYVSWDDADKNELKALDIIDECLQAVIN